MSEDRRLAATITFITNKIDFFPHMKPILADYLSKLITCFEKHFQNDNTVKFLWIQDPFNVTAPSGFTAAKEDNLTELSFDNSWDVSLRYLISVHTIKSLVQNKTACEKKTPRCASSSDLHSYRMSPPISVFY
ncbi:hypothetical protein AVEN_180008-1 [Araneus ventricosus]|uniref:Uncharacterized protein n=1 Tax=Araneus ventricosus TaxID=182803 RepID=A0A4Y2P7A2_ARAVE|nr:hypothetical protein AVEN_175296-1 [Araneus ventricosus]GBN46191.1 hypothetical protein AVEN_180008-1 [Araneus ventricosus]